MKIIKDESGDEIMRLFTGPEAPDREPREGDRWQKDDGQRLAFFNGAWTPETYEEMDLMPFWGYTLEKVVYELLAYKAQGRRVCATFNGVPLYSDSVTMDDAYIKITGMNKAAFDEYERQQLNK